MKTFIRLSASIGLFYTILSLPRSSFAIVNPIFRRTYLLVNANPYAINSDQDFIRDRSKTINYNLGTPKPTQLPFWVDLNSLDDHLKHQWPINTIYRLNTTPIDRNPLIIWINLVFIPLNLTTIYDNLGSIWRYLGSIFYNLDFGRNIQILIIFKPGLKHEQQHSFYLFTTRPAEEDGIAAWNLHQDRVRC